jgi:hypothetical protein
LRAGVSGLALIGQSGKLASISQRLNGPDRLSEWNNFLINRLQR